VGVTPLRGTAGDEPEEVQDSSDLATARRAIRAGRAEEGLSLLKALRARGDRSPLVLYWMGLAYRKLDLLELAWRHLHLASVYQPANRNFANALRSVERRLEGGLEPIEVGTPEPEITATPTPGPPGSVTAPTQSPTASPTPTVTQTPEPIDEVFEALRIRAERALRQGRPRLAVGLVQRCLVRKPDAADLLLFGADAALRDGAAAQARSLFDRHPQAKEPELTGLSARLKEQESAARPAKPQDNALDRARSALDQLFLDEAEELLAPMRIQSPQDAQVLLLLASVHALRGDQTVAKAFVEEAAFEDPALNRYIARPELLEASPSRPPHQTLLEMRPSPTPQTSPEATPAPP
jgi:tetratricopeptide (TPR) repeat protein